MSEKKIPFIKHIAVYRSHPESAITHYAAVASIEPYKSTGKYIVKFRGKARKLQRPVPRKSVGSAGRGGPQGPFFSTLKKIRAARTLADL